MFDLFIFKWSTFKLIVPMAVLYVHTVYQEYFLI